MGAPTHLLIVGIVLGVVSLVSGFWLIPAPRAAAGKVFAIPDRGLLLLGAVIFCGLFAEAAAADWSAVYLHTAANAPQDVAAWGYAAFSLAMAGTRLLGDRLVERVGSARLVRAAALTGAAWTCTRPPGADDSGGHRRVRHPRDRHGHGGSADVQRRGRHTGPRPGHGGRGRRHGRVRRLRLLAPPIIGFVAQGTSLTVALTLVTAMTALIAVPAGALRAARD